MMRQSSTQEQKTAPTSQAQSLHPGLQNALASLDWQLEAELVRYRRLRALGKAGDRPYPASRRQIPKNSETVLGAKFLERDSFPPGTISDPNRSHPSSVAANGDPGHAERTEVEGQIPSFDFEAVREGGRSQLGPTSGAQEALSGVANDAASNSAASNGDIPAAPSSLELKELAKQYASQVAGESDLVDTLDEDVPNDYLESSEALLRSLAQEEAQVQAEQGFLQNLLTPLGLGSMLLLLISSGMFGFVIVNPSSLNQLLSGRTASPDMKPANSVDSNQRPLVEAPQPNLASQEFPDLNLQTLGSLKINSGSGDMPGQPLPGKPFSGQVPSGQSSQLGPGKIAKTANLGTSGSSGIVGAVGDAAQANGANSPIVPSRPQVHPPNLAPRGLDVPSSQRLGPGTTYPPAAPTRSQEPLPPARTNYPPAVPARSQEPLPPLRRRDPGSSKSSVGPVNSSPTAPKKNLPIPVFVPTTPLSSPPIESAPLPPSGPAVAKKSDGYKVVTPYPDDRALEQAREKVPDAYLHNYPDGAKVQLGSFSDEASAQKQAEQLRKQGLPAEVYKP